MNLEMLAEVERNIHLDRLDESTLARVWTHTSEDSTAFAMLTAFRGERSETENVQKNIALASDVRAAGYGYFWLKGFTIENEGTPDEKHVTEDSLFVISKEGDNEKMKQTLLSLAKKYDQESIFFKPAGDAKGSIVSTNGEVLLSALSLQPEKMSKYYSQLKTGNHENRTFTFESAGTPSSGFSKLAKSKKLKA